MHDWDPFADPVDDCGVCNGPLDLLPFTNHARRMDQQPEAGPVQRPVRVACGYAHAECVE